MFLVYPMESKSLYKYIQIIYRPRAKVIMSRLNALCTPKKYLIVIFHIYNVTSWHQLPNSPGFAAAARNRKVRSRLSVVKPSKYGESVGPEIPGSIYFLFFRGIIGSFTMQSPGKFEGFPMNNSALFRLVMTLEYPWDPCLVYLPISKSIRCRYLSRYIIHG